MFFGPPKRAQTKKMGPCLGTRVSKLGSRTSQRCPLRPNGGQFRDWEGAQKIKANERSCRLRVPILKYVGIHSLKLEGEDVRRASTKTCDAGPDVATVAPVEAGEADLKGENGRSEWNEQDRTHGYVRVFEHGLAPARVFKKNGKNVVLLTLMNCSLTNCLLKKQML